MPASEKGKEERRSPSHSDDPAIRLMRLFTGNQRSSGRYDPIKDKNFTEHEPLTLENFHAHLAGTLGAGAVPIQDDDTCIWAAIDIDNHESDEDLPIGKADELARANKLPLVLCRSKSGGIHAYVFFNSPQPAARIRPLLTRWSGLLGYPGSEIFPKQAKLSSGQDGKRQYGNWLNLPYMGGENSLRYAVHAGAKLPLAKFLDEAEHLRLTEADLRSFASSDHPEAPPCVQKMYANGVAQGHRNEALYNITIYLKKANPDDYTTRAHEANGVVFDRPLPRAETNRTIASAGRPECAYRCNEEPIRSLCERETCLKRKFGVTPADVDRLNSIEALPEFTNLVKYLSEPVRWEIHIDGICVNNLTTGTLLDFRAMREVIAERITRVVPNLKPVEWDRLLQPLMKDARIVETPDDASVAGTIRARLREFAGKTDLMNKGDNTADRKALLRGLPVVVQLEGERQIAFRAQDFVNYLKRTKSEELKGVNLWFAVKQAGVAHNRLRVGDDAINVWYMPVAEIQNIPVPRQEFKSEL